MRRASKVMRTAVMMEMTSEKNMLMVLYMSRLLNRGNFKSTTPIPTPSLTRPENKIRAACTSGQLDCK